MLCLAVDSDDAWAPAAVAQIDQLLVDHAHCETKAASNARSLVARFPMAPRVKAALEAIVVEEEEHFAQVTALLDERGVHLEPPQIDHYAAALRRSCATLPALRDPLIDRLLVGALIEARSCERFKLLASALADPASEGAPSERGRLSEFYEALFACEARHYRTFLDLACETAVDYGEPFVDRRLSSLAQCEARIVASLARAPARAAIHG